MTSAVNRLFHWHETEKIVTNILCDWQTYVGFSSVMQKCFVVLTPWTPLLLIVATLLELIGGLFLLVGTREKLGAGLLISFLIPSTLFMHQFWFLDGPDKPMEQIMFLKNMAILGGLIMVVLHGAQTSGRDEDGFNSGSHQY